MTTMDDFRAESEWTNFERQYQPLKVLSESFTGTAALVGKQMLDDVPTRIEYMRMIRAEADDMLTQARRQPSQMRVIFDRISDRRDELRLIAQDGAKVSVKILSKLITKNRTKYQILVSAANKLAVEGKLPSVGHGKELKAIPLEKLSPDQLDEVFYKAIDAAGGSRKSITPTRMKMRGAGLLLLTVAMAGLDIYLSEDKSFATSKNATMIAGGAGGAWDFAAAGLAVGGPLGGLVGLVVGGVVGSFAAEEVHFQVRGLNARSKLNKLMASHYGLFNFDEEGLGAAIHSELLADLGSVYVLFANLNEKRNSDADDVARHYIALAKRVVLQHPNGALQDSLRKPEGKALSRLLITILEEGWTTDLERTQMQWLRQMSVAA